MTHETSLVAVAARRMKLRDEWTPRAGDVTTFMALVVAAAPEYVPAPHNETPKAAAAWLTDRPGVWWRYWEQAATPRPVPSGTVALAAADGDPSLHRFLDATGAGNAAHLAVMTRMAVAPSWWGTGLGERLVDRALAAAARHHKTLVLDVLETSPYADALYARHPRLRHVGDNTLCDGRRVRLYAAVA